VLAERGPEPPLFISALMLVNLEIERFSCLFQSFKERAFRLETLDLYSVQEEAENYRRFLKGDRPPASNNEEWCQLIKGNVTAGKVMERIHVVSVPLTPYVKFEIDWGYVHSRAAGEQIRMLDRTRVPKELGSVRDFWLFDEKVLVFMCYQKDGAFVGAEIENDPGVISEHIMIERRLLSLSLPLGEFLLGYRA
jgi:hypothetical protein